MRLCRAHRNASGWNVTECVCVCVLKLYRGHATTVCVYVRAPLVLSLGQEYKAQKENYVVYVVREASFF